MPGRPKRTTANSPNSTPLSIDTAEREEQHVHVDDDVVDARQLRRRNRAQQLDGGPARAATPTAAAREREHDALREQPARDAAAARPERRPHRELLLPALGAHEEQVRDVAARDQQHDADGGQQNPQDLATSPVTSSASGRTFGRSSSLAKAGGSSEIIRATSSLAWPSVTPGFSRASA